MPRLLLDVSRLLGRFARHRLPTGIDRVCQAWVAHFATPEAVARGEVLALVQQGRWRVVLSPLASREVFDATLLPSADFWRRTRGAVARDLLSGRAPLWTRRRHEGAIYLNLGHTGLEAAGLEGWVRASRVKPVHFVHDLIPITHPQFCRAGEAARHARRMRTLLATACGVVANSGDTLSALRRFADAHALAMPPAEVAWLAPAPLPAPSPVAPLASPYFVVLGTLEPRKNHRGLLTLWRTLVGELGPAAPHLVVIGQRGWHCDDLVRELENGAAFQGHVHARTSCTDAELSGWLAHARALLFPAFVEGFGLPLVEALAHGTPVIASRLGVFQEIAGEVPDYLEPLDLPGWREAVLAFAQPGSARRDAQLARLRGFRAPSWASHFAHAEALLERIA